MPPQIKVEFEGERQETGGVQVAFEEDPTLDSVVQQFTAPLNNLVLGLPEEILFRFGEMTGIIEEGTPRPVAGFFGLGEDPKNEIEADARAAGEFFTANLAALVPQLKAAQIAGKLPRVLAPTIVQRIRDAFLGFMRTHPGSAVLAEQTSAITAGIAEEEARQEGLGPTAQVGVGVLGGLAPGAAFLAAKNSFVGLGLRIMRRFATEGGEQMARAAVSRKLRDALDEEGERNIARAERVFQELGVEGRPSLAEASGSPNLIAAQRRIESQVTGADLNQLNRRKFDLVEEIIEGNQYRPEITGKDPDVLYDATTGRVRAVRERIQQDTVENVAEQQRLASSLREADRVAIGERLRETRDSFRTEVSNSFRRNATEIGLNDPARAFRFSEFREEFVDRYFVRSSRFADRRKPEVMVRLAREQAKVEKLQGMLQRAIENEDVEGAARIQAEIRRLGVVTFEDLQALRQDMGDQLLDALNDPKGGRNKRRLLVSALEDFDNWAGFSDQPTPGGATPIDQTLGSAWQQFRSQYRDEFITRFERGAAFRVGRVDRRGDYRIFDERVADSFLQSETTVRDFFRLFGDDADAMIALRSAALDKARTAGGVIRNDGTINQDALVRWVGRQPWLRELRVVRDELLDLASSQSALVARQNTLKQRALRLDKMALSSALGMDSEDFVDTALSNPRMAATLGRVARRNGLEDAAVASVWGVALRRIDTPEGELPNPTRLLQWINENEEGIRAMLRDDTHIDALRNVYSALAMVERVPVAQGRAEALGPLQRFEQATGTGIPQISSRIFAAESGRVGYRYMAVDALSRFFNTKARSQQDALLAEALFDERLAKDLAAAQQLPASADADVRAGLNTWLIVLGFPQPEGRFE